MTADADKAADKAADEPTFESATERLAHVVEQLEGGDLPLEKALELFEEGVRLARSAQARLDRAERRVEELLGIDAKGQPVTRSVAGYARGDEREEERE
jgi:exodeoxyribonuclease VII small subunit